LSNLGDIEFLSNLLVGEDESVSSLWSNCMT